MTERYEAPEEAQENLLPKPGTTGRYVVRLEPTKAQQGLDVLRQIGVVPSTIFEGAGEGVDAAQLNDQETIYLKDFGHIVGHLSQEQLEQIRAAAEANTAVLSVEPETINQALSFP